MVDLYEQVARQIAQALGRSDSSMVDLYSRYLLPHTVEFASSDSSMVDLYEQVARQIAQALGRSDSSMVDLYEERGYSPFSCIFVQIPLWSISTKIKG